MTVIEEKVMDKAEAAKIRQQILAIRDTGRTNMFDAKTVQVIANEMRFYELVVFIEECLGDYSHFIITGDLPGLTNEEALRNE